MTSEQRIKHNSFIVALAAVLFGGISSIVGVTSQNNTTHSVVNSEYESVSNKNTNQPIFSISQLTTGTAGMGGLGDFSLGGYALHDGAYGQGKQYIIDNAPLTFSIDVSNYTEWTVDADKWLTFNYLNNEGCIGSEIRAGFVNHDWSKNGDQSSTGVGQVAWINDKTGYTSNYQPQTPIPVSIPLWLHPITYDNPQPNNATYPIGDCGDNALYAVYPSHHVSWETKVDIPGSSGDEYVLLCTTLLFIKPDSADRYPAKWDDFDFGENMELYYDGTTHNVKMRLTSDLTCILAIYPKIYNYRYDYRRPWHNWTDGPSLFGGNYATLHLDEYEPDNTNPAFEYLEEYIDIGFIDLVWIKTNTNVVITRHGGYTTMILNETSLVVYKITGELQVGRNFYDSLARFEIVPALDTPSNANPAVNPPVCDFDSVYYTDGTQFTFHITFWWWDPCVSPSWMDIARVGTLNFLDNADRDRSYGIINVPVLTCV